MSDTAVSRGSGEAPAILGRVSVVIPAYNCAATIGAAIDSVLGQDFGDFEVIVVDDGSTDGTAAALAGFGPRIRVVSQPNGGLAAARNAGQRAASGEYIAWMDGDDLMLPGRIRLGATVLAGHPGIGVVCSDFSAFEDVEVTLHSCYMSSYYAAVGRRGGVSALFPEVVGTVGSGEGTVAVRSGRIYEALVWGNFVHPPTVMARRSVLLEAGFGDQSLRFSSDYDLILRMARLTSFGFIAAPLLRYRLSRGQMSHVNSGERMQLETARILERIQHDDPGLGPEMQAVLRLRIAESHIHAADAIGTTDRTRALGLLVRGLNEKWLLGPAAFALARIVVTPALAQNIKHALRAVGIRWTVFSSWGLPIE